MVRRKNHLSEVATTKKRKRNSTCLAFVGNRVFKVSQKVILEIHDLQISTKQLIPKLPFGRLVKEIMQDFCRKDYRMHGLALFYLQEAAEDYLVEFLEDSYKSSASAGRITLMPRDMQLVKKLRSRYEPYVL